VAKAAVGNSIKNNAIRRAVKPDFIIGKIDRIARMPLTIIWQFFALNCTLFRHAARKPLAARVAVLSAAPGAGRQKDGKRGNL